MHTFNLTHKQKHMIHYTQILHNGIRITFITIYIFLFVNKLVI